MKKIFIIFLKTLLIGSFPFLLSSIASGARLPLGISEGLKNTLDGLKINTEKLSLDEVRFLQDFLDNSPVGMLENEKARRAIFESSSSYGDKTYRRFFFSRLNPHSHEQMSAFIESLENHSRSIYDKSIGAATALYDPSATVQAAINALRKGTAGVRLAIQNGEFNISLNDLRALYANHISKSIKKIPEDKLVHDNVFSKREMKFSFAILELYSFFQATVNSQSGQKILPRTSRGGENHHESVNSIASTFLGFLRRLFGQTGSDAFVVSIIHAMDISTTFSKKERDFLKSMDGVFTSSLYKPSAEFEDLFHIAFMVNPNILDDPQMILKFWNSSEVDQNVFVGRFGIEIRSISDRRGISNVLDMAVSNLTGGRMADPSNRMVEVYRDLVVESKFFKAMLEASRESDEIAEFVEEVTRPIIGILDAGGTVH